MKEDREVQPPANEGGYKAPRASKNKKRRIPHTEKLK